MSSHSSSPSSSTSELQATSEIMPRQTLIGHTRSVRGVVCVPDVRRVITCSWDGSLRLWNLENGQQIGDDWRDENDVEVLTMALSPNSKTVASGSHDRKVRLWDVGTGQVIARWTEDSTCVESVCWSPNGERLLCGSRDGTAWVRNVESGETIMGPSKTGHDEVYAVAYSPDGSKFATGGFSNASIWDSRTGKQLHGLRHSFTIWCLAWTSEKFICGSFHSIRIFDTTTWNEIANLDTHNTSVTAITLSRNNRLLASASLDCTARLWDLETNLQVGLSLYHEKEVKCATLSADGMCLVTGCYNTNTYVWDVGAILNEHHLEHLLPISDAVSDADEQSFLNADATGVEDEDADQLPPDFFHDHVYSAETHQPRRSARYRLGALASSLASRPNALFSGISSLFHRPKPSTDEVIDNIPPPQITLSAPISTTARAALRRLSNLWPIRPGHSPSPPIADVPFAQGRQRIATAGAPARHDDCVRDEDFDSPPPSPNPNSQQPSATDHVPSPPPPSNLNSHPPVAVLRPPGEHGGGRLCFCL